MACRVVRDSVCIDGRMYAGDLGHRFNPRRKWRLGGRFRNCRRWTDGARHDFTAKQQRTMKRLRRLVEPPDGQQRRFGDSGG